MTYDPLKEPWLPGLDDTFFFVFCAPPSKVEAARPKAPSCVCFFTIFFCGEKMGQGQGASIFCFCFVLVRKKMVGINNV